MAGCGRSGREHPELQAYLPHALVSALVFGFLTWNLDVRYVFDLERGAIMRRARFGRRFERSRVVMPLAEVLSIGVTGRLEHSKGGVYYSYWVVGYDRRGKALRL